MSSLVSSPETGLSLPKELLISLVDSGQSLLRCSVRVLPTFALRFRLGTPGLTQRGVTFGMELLGSYVVSGTSFLISSALLLTSCKETSPEQRIRSVRLGGRLLTCSETQS